MLYYKLFVKSFSFLCLYFKYSNLMLIDTNYVKYICVYVWPATARSQILMIHVQYFGDKGRHSWVSSNSMIPFTNLADFKKLSESITAEVKKRDAKYAAAFIVKPGIKSKWESAIEEAMEVQPMSNDDRANIFKPKEKNIKNKSSKISEEKDKVNKRKHSSDSNGPDLKRTKQDNVSIWLKYLYTINNIKN